MSKMISSEYLMKFFSSNPAVCCQFRQSGLMWSLSLPLLLCFSSTDYKYEGIVIFKMIYTVSREQMKTRHVCAYWRDQCLDIILKTGKSGLFFFFNLFFKFPKCFEYLLDPGINNSTLWFGPLVITGLSYSYFFSLSIRNFNQELH